MFEKFGFAKKLSKNEEIEKLLKDAVNVCNTVKYDELDDFDISGYTYSSSEAVEELGLDAELIHQLLEDYVSQILKSVELFRRYVNKIRVLNKANQVNEYIKLRELVHKNLGVARNLRIKDAEKILFIIMKKENLDELELYIKLLESCAIRLKPKCAYDAITLMKVKNSL
jgi:hypothetical protein